MHGLVGIGLLPRALILSDTYAVHGVAPSITFFGLILWWIGINVEAAVKNAKDPKNSGGGLNPLTSIAAAISSVLSVSFVWMLSGGDLLGSVLWFTVYAFPVVIPIWLIAVVSSWQYLKEKKREALADKMTKPIGETENESKKIEVMS
jgi:hypothetical protein